MIESTTCKGIHILSDFFTLPSVITLGTYTLKLLLAYVLAGFIVIIYQWTHLKGPDKSFTDTLIMLCMLISVVMIIIDDSIARAFALVGALSIIRFRTAIQDPRDIGFVFYALAAGMAVGADNPAVAILATFVIGVILLCMFYWNKHFSNENEFTLEFCIPPNSNLDTTYRLIFDKYIMNDRLIDKRIKRSQIVELIFRVKMIDPSEWIRFFNELSNVEEITDVKIDKV
ncbi:hypothetical protein C6497_11225 [Candidatus Poribacteria bacterium]|nr:MAG: hypothetical protein C6497_11225 [Candidatus Poribacteria bacterium]